MINPAYIAEMIRQSRKPQSAQPDLVADRTSGTVPTELPTPRRSSEPDTEQRAA